MFNNGIGMEIKSLTGTMLMERGMVTSRFSKKTGKRSFMGFLKMAISLKPIMVFKMKN
jgi:hypothetical protein